MRSMGMNRRIKREKKMTFGTMEGNWQGSKSVIWKTLIVIHR